MDAGQMELYSAEHLFVPSDSDPLPTSRRLSSGKGIGRAQARTSALCEALERYSGMFRGSETRLRASYETLREVAVPPNACTTFSDAQFDNRDVWNSRSVPHCHVPRRLDERQNIDWSPVWSLTHDRVRYVPTAYCYYGYRAAPDEQCCRADSNGCAAGSGLEEAILQGFLELVERDAVAIWWYNGIKRPALDLRTFSRPFFRTMIAEYARGGRSLTVFDLTTDLGIPVFAAASEAENSGATELLLGFGAHLDAETAVARAITELNQWRCGTALGVAGTSFSQSGRGLGAFLRRGRSVRPRRLEDFACADHADLRDAVLDCVERARHCGLEVLVLDQTREDVGLSVVRVIVPGLRHFWPRFGPGRLYDVPVALGWRRTPKTERQLNNFHITI
jgi:ribosomal protein S12 methylthiotransferase accessory factor